MKRIAIMGNAGAGKSTLARSLASEGMAILDLDRIVWQPESSPLMRERELVLAGINEFCTTQEGWIVEGCYGDLIEAVLPWEPELIFLNPGARVCLRNCRHRPWEPHKYPSKAEQDANLSILLAWVSAYYSCGGPMSLAGHRAILDAYSGPKRELGELTSY